MSTAAAPQDRTTANAFVEYQKQVASRLRYDLARFNLQHCHDLSKPLRVLDAAGGNGLNAQYYLQQGHTVTLFDYDPAMLEEARQRLAGLDLLPRLQLSQGKLEEAAERLPAAHFELILCHHVLEYTSDWLHVLKALAAVTAPAGELSLITLNPVSEVLRAVLFRRDPALASARLTDLRYDAKWFGQAQMATLEQTVAWAEQAGWALRDFRAVRVLADYLPEEQATAREAEVLRLEQELSGREPYRRFGRYLQFCFRKQAG